MADLQNGGGGFGRQAVEQEHEAEAFGAGPAVAAEGAALAVGAVWPSREWQTRRPSWKRLRRGSRSAMVPASSGRRMGPMANRSPFLMGSA
jgi:hypothetical protein